MPKPNLIPMTILVILISVIFLIANLASTTSASDEENASGSEMLSATGGVIVVGGSAFADYSDLQEAIDAAQDGMTIIIEPGTYYANPEEFTEYLCGNCLNAATNVNASRGFYIKGKSIILQGLGSEKTSLVTNAGYGLFVEDCPVVKVYNLGITGGKRDQDGAATCAAVVVRNSSVEVANCLIHDNQGDFEKPICGIGGVFGREGAILDIHHNIIRDNSWDGVALYRGAVAQIHDNKIFNGRGAGVGITWDARADVIRNDIHDYWKGIGSFGETRVGVFGNFVHDLRGWGIIASGTSDMICRNNTVVRCGNVGIAGWDETARITIVNNIIANNGTVDKWVAPRVGIWMNCIEGNYRIANNIFWENHDCDVAFGYVEGDNDWTYAEERIFVDTQGNMNINPLLVDGGPELHITSPCIDAGDEQYLDLDGTRSDIGANLNPQECPIMVSGLSGLPTM